VPGLAVGGRLAPLMRRLDGRVAHVKRRFT
jgi:hypothetical protein